MGVWKSPVFYFGIALIAILSAALAAPYVVNWNSYRDTIESYGRQVSGRDLVIKGNISARLFPWPRLVVENVSVGNPEGFSDQPMMAAKSISMQLNLGGLLAGNIFVEGIDVEQPVVTLTRIDSTKVNWLFHPEKSVLDSKFLDHVKLDKINVNDGTLKFQDRQNSFETAMTNISAALAAPELVGPWRMRGTAAQGQVPVMISFNSNPLQKDEAFKFGVRIEPQDGSWPALALEGDILDSNLKGKIRFEPVVTEDGKESLEASFKPLQLQASIDANFDHVNLDAIQIVPVDTKDNGTLIEGIASVRFDNGVKAKLDLTSPRLDLDTLFGSQSLRVWRAGGVMATLNNIIKDFPQKLDLTTSFKISNISAAGQTLENLNLTTSAEQNAIRVNEFSANLPGRSRFKFNGIVFPGDTAAELGGSLALESNDTRAFLGWLWPEGDQKIAQIWKGSRGRLKAQTDLTWSGTRFGFQNLAYELDGAGGSAELAVQLGKLSSIDLKLKTENLDLDSYLSGGLAQILQGTNPLGLLQSDDGFDKRIKISAGALRLNGIEAKQVALDFNSGLSGFEVKAFDIASVEGASVHAKGLVLQGPDGPSGDVHVSVAAENPRGFLQLLGATANGREPAWSQALGATQLQLNMNVKPGVTEPLLTYDVSGQTGALHVSATGDVKDIAKAQDATFGISAEITTGSSSALMSAFGVKSIAPSSTEAKLNVTAKGSTSNGFKSVVDGRVFGANFGFSGTLKGSELKPEVTGKLALDAADATELGHQLGLPLATGLVGPLHLNFNTVPHNGGHDFEQFLGEINKQKISGTVGIEATGKINADLTLDELALRDVLAVSFLPWDGKPAMLDAAFAKSLNNREGEIWLHPLTFQTDLGPDLGEAVLGIAFGKSGRHVTVAARDENSEPLKIDITVQPEGGVFSTTGSVHLPLDLEQVLRLQDGSAVAKGKVIIDGTFEGQGRSPLAILNGLKSEATYVLRDAVLLQLSPDAFFTKLKDVKTTADLQSLFDGLLRPPGTELLAQQLPLRFENGVVKFDSLTLTRPDADIVLTSSFDFTTGEFEADANIIADASLKIPDMKVIYSGSPLALRRRSDLSAVASTLGFKLVARDLAELERVQKEQEKAAADELAQQKVDEEKFAAFQAQRNELRLRLREQKIFDEQRLERAVKLKAELAKLIREGAVLNKAEIEKYLRSLQYLGP